MLFSMSLIVCTLRFRPLIHFELIFVQGMRQESNPALLIEKVVLSSSWIVLTPSQIVMYDKSFDCMCMGFYLGSQFSSPDLEVCHNATITILINTVMQYILKSGIEFSSFVLSKIVLAVVSPLHFHMNFRINLSLSAKKLPRVLTKIVLNLWHREFQS